MNKQDCGFIYTQYRDKVFGFAHSKIVNQTEAEDIVQTVFLKVYSNLDIAKAFGHGAGFGFGLWLFPYIFTFIIGFGKSEYVGNPLLNAKNKH